MRYCHGLGWVLLAALLAAACGSGGAAPRADAPAAAPAASGPASGGQSAAPAPAASATDAPLAPLPQKVVIAYSSVSGSYLPVYTTAEAGLFTKNGLDVEMTYIASGTTALQSLIANEVHFVVTSAPEPTAAYVSGAPARMVAAWNVGIAALFMVDQSITRPEDLKGKPIGISRFGGQPHVGARLALKKWGLDPTNDVQYIQLGGVGEILAGMQQGAVVGGVFSPPTNVRAQRLGFRVLGDLAQMDVGYQSDVLAAMQPYLEANPEVARRVVRALVEGIKVALQDDALAASAMGKYTRIEEQDVLNETVAYIRTVLKRTPYPSLPALQNHLDEVAESGDLRAREVRPQQLVNTTALEQLEREGFIKLLYGE
jgi:NitT/TauT family transport system substrate-binding protein